MTATRIKNVCARFVNEETFYTNRSPRISRKEIEEFRQIGIYLNTEHDAGALAGPIVVFPNTEDDWITIRAIAEGREVDSGN
jgi:hypothetical protein